MLVTFHYVVIVIVKSMGLWPDSTTLLIARFHILFSQIIQDILTDTSVTDTSVTVESDDVANIFTKYSLDGINNITDAERFRDIEV